MGRPTFKRENLVIYALLALITVAVYWQVAGFDLTNFDDSFYVKENPMVTSGLSPSTIHWALTTNYQSNWHPLTWMSLMADSEIAGILSWFVDMGQGSPGIYHVTNVVFHIAAALLLFLVLFRMTGSRWKSVFVAALFAVHPLHVESVAWVSERKDVLSTFFWMLTMWCYVLYVERPDGRRFAYVFAAFALGLLSKPMLVSLPVVLLLMDYWPLRRAAEGGEPSADSMEKGTPPPAPLLGREGRWGRLVREKMPLFVLAAGSCVVTFWAQKTGGAVGSFEHYPVGVRVANAAVSYAGYILKMFWPTNLSILYPHPGAGLPAWQVAGSLALIAAITLVAVRTARTRPYVIVGWLWYLITLVPVIGLVQVGKQAMADRYSYVPLIGLFVIIAWAAADLVPARAAARKAALAAIASAVVLALMVGAYAQVGYWRDSTTLFTHAIAVTTGNSLAYNNLGSEQEKKGDLDHAAANFRLAIKYHPEYTDAHYNLGNVLGKQGNFDEAMVQFRIALKQSDNRFGEAHNGLGVCLAHRGRLDEAIYHYREALKINPNNENAQANLQEALAAREGGR